jgi:pimeloyl-ACP methyl ester carboxylesterase
MTPFYFGSSDRQLFGIYEAARCAPVKGATVLCHPWGPEYIHAHRSLRKLSNMLAATGFHTLRFDYFGTGDSAGDMTEAGLAGWEADIRTAMSELLDITGAKQVSLVGLRLGAALAANVAVAAGAKVSSLVLWDPVLSGEEHVRELHVESPPGVKGIKPPPIRPWEDGGGHDILGFPLTDQMASEMKTLDLIALASTLPARSLVVASHPLPSHDGLRRVLDENERHQAIELIADHPPWIELPLGHPLSGTAPVKVLRRIVQWLA